MNLKRIFALCMVLLLLVPSFALADSHAPKEGPSISTPAAELRATLSQLLASHFEFQTLVAIKEFEGAEDAEAVEKQLDQNAAALADAVGSVYGEEGAQQFAEIFSSQYDNTAGLAEAVKSGDEAQIEEIKKQLLEEFPAELGGFLSTATGGALPAEAAEEVLRAHEQYVLDVFFSYTDGDFDAAYESFNEGYKQMYAVGAALAQAIVTQMPDKFEHTEAITPASDLEATLNQLLGLHLDYQVLTAIKQFEGAEDAEAVEKQLNQNAEEVAAAVGSIYGEEAAQQFDAIFAGQYEDTEGFALAVKSGDEAQIEATKQVLLQEFPAELGGFLSTATGGALPADVAEEAIRAHEQDVIDIFMSYTEGDFDTAYERFNTAEDNINVVGTALAGAIVTQMPDKFAATPGMPETGMGGMADSGNMNWILYTFPLLALAGALVFTRRKALQE
ncbi:hypothetical protein [Planococcus halotolerans]|uniref:Copper amine oxidase n=1 Tax=Planococcus halotolerans TaxID=2233542 RepID=A0A365KJX5_9BACL|nr:hypothetical protein [Planococcus halotolerans]RAZ73450.1 hypothetical protein DP120_17105 [Planococcus halotolerans]